MLALDIEAFEPRVYVTITDQVILIVCAWGALLPEDLEPAYDLCIRDQEPLATWNDYHMPSGDPEALCFLFEKKLKTDPVDILESDVTPSHWCNGE